MGGADAVTDERARDLLAGATRARVDDRRRVAQRPQSAEEGAEAVFAVLCPLDVVAEVGPVDARAHDLERPAERLRDRLGVRGGRRRGHPEDRGISERVERAADEQVVRAEVVPPHAHAVHLVDHDEAHADPAQRLDERLLAEPLGRRVEESRLACRDRREAGAGLLGVEGRVDEGRSGRGTRRKLVHLILHQCDER